MSLLLQWHHYSSSISKMVTSLYGSDKLCDTTIVCEGKQFPTHKIILSACSTYLYKVFAMCFDNYPIVILTDAKAECLQFLLSYMYTGEVRVPENMLQHVIKLAKDLQIKDLCDIRLLDEEINSQSPQEHLFPQKKPQVNEAEIAAEEEINSSFTNIRDKGMLENEYSKLSNKSLCDEGKECASGAILPHLQQIAKEFQITDLCNAQLLGNKIYTKSRRKCSKPQKLQQVTETAVEGNKESLSNTRRKFSLKCKSSLKNKPLHAEDSDSRKVLEGKAVKSARKLNSMKSVRCYHCTMTFPKPCNLASHLKRHNKLGIFCCSDCSFTSKTKEALLKHLLKHPKCKIFLCPYCSFITSYDKALLKHLQEHCKNNLIPCEFCQHWSRNKEEKLEHMTKHTEIHMMCCKECGVYVGNDASMKKHMKIHESVNPYFCNTEYSYLKRHIKCHSKRKPYQCGHCDFKTTNKTALRSHTFNHTGKQPYACSFCDFKSTYKSHLTKHLRKTCNKKKKSLGC